MNGILNMCEIRTYIIKLLIICYEFSKINLKTNEKCKFNTIQSFAVHDTIVILKTEIVLYYIVIYSLIL